MNTAGGIKEFHFLSKVDWKHIFKTLGNVIVGILLLCMAILVFSMVQSRLMGGPPGIAGYQLYNVIGGSMSPAFEAGSLAIVDPVDAHAIETGDIITFRTSAESGSLTTHRVVEVREFEGNPSFITRGDANQVDDPGLVLSQNVVGRVVMAIPLIGYVLYYAHTKLGLVFMVLLPGSLIIYYEVRYLIQCAAELEREEHMKTHNQP